MYFNLTVRTYIPREVCYCLVMAVVGYKIDGIDVPGPMGLLVGVLNAERQEMVTPTGAPGCNITLQINFVQHHTLLGQFLSCKSAHIQPNLNPNANHLRGSRSAGTDVATPPCK